MHFIKYFPFSKTIFWQQTFLRKHPQQVFAILTILFRDIWQTNYFFFNCSGRNIFFKLDHTKPCFHNLLIAHRSRIKAFFIGQVFKKKVCSKKRISNLLANVPQPPLNPLTSTKDFSRFSFNLKSTWILIQK